VPDGARQPQARAHGDIEIRLRNLAQLFNSMDPSPFHERDLDSAAEAFIVDWARELPRERPLKIVLHLQERPPGADPGVSISTAVANYFEQRAQRLRSDMHEELRRGRLNLLIGGSFMLACLLITELFGGYEQRGILANFLFDGLTILGWVAMWRPLDTFLYEYWHLRGCERLYRRIAAAPLELRCG